MIKKARAVKTNIYILIIALVLVMSSCQVRTRIPPPVTFTVTVTEGEGYTVSPKSKFDIISGESAAFKIMLNSGYENYLVAVSINGTPINKNESGEYVIPNIKSNTTVSVAIAPFEGYKVTFNTMGGEQIYPVKVFNELWYPPATKANKVFSHWCKDPALTERFAYGEKVVSDMTLYAVYAEPNNVVMLDTPVIIINTEYFQTIESKETYLNAVVTVTNTDEQYCFEGKAAGVRGRGNYTWTLDKKGYRIKFDKKTSMLGEESAKNWTLIPNYTDKSNMRNFLALNFANRLDNLMWNSSARYVELYINEEYLGLYLLCEQNQVNENRVDIEEGSTDIDTGYFIERDRYALFDGSIEGVDYFTTSPPGAGIVPGDPAAFCYLLKSPASDDDNYSPAQFNYIKNYFINVESAIVYRDYETFIELCDEASFIDYFMVDQVFTNWEANRLSSFYMYKDKGEKLSLGPVWDFDLSVGIAPGQPRDGFVTTNYWFMKLMEIPQFKENFKQRYYQLQNQLDKIFDDIKYVQQNHALAINHNYEKWDITLTIYPENHSKDAPLQYFSTYKQHKDYVEQFLKDRIIFLNNNMKHW